MTSCSLVERKQHFMGNLESSVWVGESSAIKTYAACIHDTFIHVYQTTRIYAPEDSKLSTVHFKETSLKFKGQQRSCRQAVFISQLNHLYHQPALNVSIISAGYFAGSAVIQGSSETRCTGRRKLFVVLILGIHMWSLNQTEFRDFVHGRYVCNTQPFGAGIFFFILAHPVCKM
jgi:hypothetical protein